MLRCRDIVRHGEEFLSGDMRGWRRAGFWLHLLLCRDCRRYIRELRLTRDVSRRLMPPSEAGDAEIDAILARIAEATGTQEKGCPKAAP